MKKWYQSKTNWFNFLVFVVAVLGIISKQEFIPQEYIPYIAALIAMINVGIRTFFTSVPVERKIK